MSFWTWFNFGQLTVLLRCPKRSSVRILKNRRRMLYCSVFKQRFINKQLKNLTQIAGTTFKIVDVFLWTKCDNKCALRSISVYHSSEELRSRNRPLRSETDRLICEKICSHRTVEGVACLSRQYSNYFNMGWIIYISVPYTLFKLCSCY